MWWFVGTRFEYVTCVCGWSGYIRCTACSGFCSSSLSSWSSPAPRLPSSSATSSFVLRCVTKQSVIGDVRVYVFSVLFNEVFYIWATEYEGSIIKATTTIVVVALPSRSDIATVNRWRSCFSSCCRTSLECCLAWCHLSQLFASFQMSAEDGALSAELSGSCSNCIWLIYD